MKWRPGLFTADILELSIADLFKLLLGKELKQGGIIVKRGR